MSRHPSNVNVKEHGGERCASNTTTNKADKSEKMESSTGQHRSPGSDYLNLRVYRCRETGTTEIQGNPSRDNPQDFGDGRQSCATWVTSVLFKFLGAKLKKTHFTKLLMVLGKCSMKLRPVVIQL